MTQVRAGDILALTIASREYDTAGEGSADITLSGRSNDFKLNGNGTGHVTQKRKAAGFSGLPLSIDATRQDLEALQEIQTKGEAVPVIMTLVNGVAYSGSLVIVGDLNYSSGEGTATIEMRGEKFEQQ